jgi:simple sugar transport system permease protein
MDPFLGQVVSFARLMMESMVPFVLAAQGTMLAGRTGLFNVAQEGMMLVGASLGFLVAYQSGSQMTGILAAALVGGAFALLLAYLTTTLKMNQFVIGIALFFSGVGISTLIPKLSIGVTLLQPLIPTLVDIPLPLISRIPVIGPILFTQNAMVYFSILVSILLWWFLYKTKIGRDIRAVGENPMAADTMGINVTVVRYLATIVGGLLIGLAGVYLPLVYTGTFTEGMVRGRGFIAIALAFFGGWSPIPIFFGSLFFAAVEVLAYRVQVGASVIPYQFLQIMPYVATILVMMFSFYKSPIPRFLGENYDREKRSQV